MKLYDCTPAPSPRRVRIFAAEKGIDLDIVQVDLGNAEQMSAEFRQLNPDCTVPVLQLDDGFCISEAFAICDYLEQTHPEPLLMGSDPRKRAEILMWNSKIEQTGFAAVAEFYRNSTKGLKSRALTGPADFEQIPELAERGRQRTLIFCQRMDAHLDGRKFVAGDDYSLADISAFITVDFVRRAKLDALESAKHLSHWYERVSSRPSASA